MIDPNFIHLAAQYAGKETPERLREVCHRLTALNKILYDLKRTPFLSHLGHTNKSPNQMEYYQLTAHRETLFALFPPFLNMAYLFTLAETHKKPIADLHTVSIDAAKGFPVADVLRKKVDATVDKWRGIMAEIRDHEAAENLFYQIRDHYTLPPELKEAAAEIVFFTFLYTTGGIMRMPDDYLSGFTTHSGNLAAQAAEAKTQWFEKLLESLELRKRKTGKLADNAGFIGAVRGLEDAGAKITKKSRGRKVFDGEKIFKAMKPYTRENPYQFEDYDVFIEEIPDPQGFMDPSIFQITPDLKERHLETDSFRKRVLSRMTPF